MGIRSGRSTRTLALALGLYARGAAAQEDDVLSKVDAGIRRGMGDVCTLTAEKAQGSDGYYRCLDVGPYRFVYEYGLVRGYVVLKGAKPFAILESRDGRSSFLVGGPWTEDMGRRIDEWWDDEVEGGRERRAGQEAESKRRQDAEAAVNGFGAQDPRTAPAPAPTQDAPNAPPTQAGDGPGPQPGQQYAPQQYAPQPYAPQQYAPQQYAPGQSIDPSSAYLPPGPSYPNAAAAPSDGSDTRQPVFPVDVVPPGGRLLAPGVVQDPPGTR